MFTYITEFKVREALTGKLRTFCGPNVKADSREEAREWLDNNYFGYAKIAN